MAGCSPDGLVGDEGGVEIKCCDAEGHLEIITAEFIKPDPPFVRRKFGGNRDTFFDSLPKRIHSRFSAHLDHQTASFNKCGRVGKKRTSHYMSI